jgi:hypothetical protein
MRFRLMQLEDKRNNPELAQQHYTIAHQLFTQLGAAKQIEKLEAWRTEDGRERTEDGEAIDPLVIVLLCGNDLK